jgi:enoyl-CoA hydratase/carnithine racemase
MTNEPEILFERRGAAGLVTLNRPQALNAVTLIMVRALRQQLDSWRDDPSVTRVVIMGAGGRAFSAGGDLRQVYELGRSGRQDEALIYWREEYALNDVIKHYPKPYVALLDGIVMGGGVGVSVHGSHRIAGDKFLFAMPEVGIGFFPDVGATWFLPRMPGEFGTFSAVTGERLGSADAVSSGIATHRVGSADIPKLIDALCEASPIDQVVAAHAGTPEAGPVTARRAVIDRMFGADAIETILSNLDREAKTGQPDAQWAEATAATIRSRSPTSVKLALAQVRWGRERSFAECMRAEFRIVSRIVHDHDFYEGVRALIIDKDNQPRWRPATLAEVTDKDIERHFLPVEHELQLP